MMCTGPALLKLIEEERGGAEMKDSWGKEKVRGVWSYIKHSYTNN